MIRSKWSAGKGRAASSGITATQTPNGDKLRLAIVAFGSRILGGRQGVGRFENLGQHTGEHFTSSGLDVENPLGGFYSWNQHLGVTPGRAFFGGSVVEPREVPTFHGLRLGFGDESIKCSPSLHGNILDACAQPVKYGLLISRHA